MNHVSAVVACRRLRVHAAAAGVLLLAYFAVVLQGLGVAPSDTARYFLYVALVTWAPGIAVAIALGRKRIGTPALICLGAGLGYVIEGYLFIALGMLNLRGFSAGYAVVGIAATVWLAWTWWHQLNQSPVEAVVGPVSVWVAAVTIGAVGTVYPVSLAYLSSVRSHVALQPIGPDLFLHLSTAAEIKHHWPVIDPRMVGVPFSYHYLSHIHMAAASRTTGIDLQVVLFRLYIVPVLSVIALNAWVLTRMFSASAAVLQLALIMTFFAGTTDLSFFSGPVMGELWRGGALVSLGDPWIYSGNAFFSGISPSLLLGLAMFLPLTGETIALLDEGVDSWRRFLVVGVLMAGSMVAKGSFMPVYAIGMTLATAWLWRLRDGRWRRAFVLTVLSVVICVPLYFVFFYQYFQGEGAPAIIPFEIVKYTELWGRFEPVLRSLWQAGAITGSVDWTFRLIALLTAAIVIASYFVVCFGPRLLGIGYLARRDGVRMSAAGITFVSLVVGSLAPSYLLSLTDGNQMHFLNSAYPLAGIMGAAGLGYIVFRTRPTAGQRGLQVLAIAILLLSTWNSVYTFIADYQIRHVRDVVEGSPNVLKGSDSYAAQRWIEQHTSTSAVLAINLFSEDDARLGRRVDYSAFAERRVLLEGAHYLRGRDPASIALRRALLAAVFRQGDASALKAMGDQFYVTHLVVDTSDGLPVKLPEGSLTVVFENPTVRVYKVNQHVAWRSIE